MESLPMVAYRLLVRNGVELRVNSGGYIHLASRGSRPAWTGTMEDYFALYRATAEAVKPVGTSLHAGGPALCPSGPPSNRWVIDQRLWRKHLTCAMQVIGYLRRLPGVRGDTLLGKRPCVV
jgi:hypothetical protein